MNGKMHSLVSVGVKGRKFAHGIIVVLLFSILLVAQRRGDEGDYDQGGNGVSVGGNWTAYRSEDRMTAENRVRFMLPADNARDSDERAQVILYCTDGKLKLADFRPNLKLSRPNWPGFWGQPQMHVRVRIDDHHDDHNWNWVNGHFLAMDKGTARQIIGAHLVRIEFNTPEGPRIAEFSPAGLDFQAVRTSCGLTPKKP